MDVRIVSTYNPDNWGTFVQRNLGSWGEHLDAELVVYHEAHEPLMPSIVWRKWEDIPGAVEFIEEAERFPPACGRFGSRYDYHYDAAKFSRKVFAQCDAAEEETDLLVWLDSDVEVTRDIPAEQWAEWLLGMPMGIFSRPGFHTETGVVVWDMRDQRAREFFRGYRTLYENRRLYCLTSGWHDCWALDFVMKEFAIPFANFTKGRGDFHHAHANLEVVSASELGAYLRHDKGMRKHAA